MELMFEMANILIAPLGVGPTEKREYNHATYTFCGENDFIKTPFAAAFLVQKLNIDKVFFIGTAHSLWEEVYRFFTEESGGEVDVEYWDSLAEKVFSSNHKEAKVTKDDLVKVNNAVDLFLKKVNPRAKGGTHCFLISYGISEKEIWKNADVFWDIKEKLADEDNVYLDITHSFRHIPLFMYLMMDFTQMLSGKNVKLQGIYYGMLDITKELGHTPVVDLGSLFKISEWIKGVYEFINYGNGYLIADLIQREKGENSFSDRIKTISDLLNLNGLVNLRDELKGLKKALGSDDLPSIPMFKYILPQFEMFFKNFSNLDNDFLFQMDLSAWYFKNKKYATGYICLLEALLTGLCDVFELEANYDNKEIIKNFLHKGKRECRQFNLINQYEHLEKNYKKINRVRQLAAHSSLEKGISYQKYIDQALEIHQEIKKLFEKKDKLAFLRFINIVNYKN